MAFGQFDNEAMKSQLLQQLERDYPILKTLPQYGDLRGQVRADLTPTVSSRDGGDLVERGPRAGSFDTLDAPPDVTFRMLGGSQGQGSPVSNVATMPPTRAQREGRAPGPAPVPVDTINRPPRVEPFAPAAGPPLQGPEIPAGGLPPSAPPPDQGPVANQGDLRARALAAVEKSRAAEKRRLEGMRDIAEGLGNIEFTSGAEIRSGVHGGQEPFIDETSRVRLGEFEDQEDGARMTELLRARGIDVSDGMTGSQLKQMFPFLANEQNNQARIDYAKATYEPPRPPKMDAADKKFLDSSESAIRNFESILEMKDDINTGPIAGRVQGAGEAIGVLGGEEGGFVDFRQRVIEQSNIYIKEMTGAQMSAQEAKRLLKAMPKVTDQDEAFRRKLKNVLEQVRQKRDTFLRNRGELGYDTGDIEQQSVDLEEKVVVIGADGVRRRIPRSDAEYFLSTGEVTEILGAR